MIHSNAETNILLAGGPTLLERYRRAAPTEQQEIVIASVLKAQGWLWTLQGVL